MLFTSCKIKEHKGSMTRRNKTISDCHPVVSWSVDIDVLLYDIIMNIYYICGNQTQLTYKILLNTAILPGTIQEELMAKHSFSCDLSCFLLSPTFILD